MRKILSILTIVILLISCSKDEAGGDFFSDIKDTTWVSIESVKLNGKTVTIFVSVGKDGIVSQGYTLENNTNISCRNISTEGFIGLGGSKEIIKNSKSIFISKTVGTSEPTPTITYFILSKNNNQIKYIYSSSEDVNDISSYKMEYALQKTSINYESYMSKCVD